MKNIIIGLSTMLALHGANDGKDISEISRSYSDRGRLTLSHPEMTLAEYVEYIKHHPEELGEDRDANWDGDQLPGHIPSSQETDLHLPKENVFSRQVSLNAFPDSDDEESTPLEGSVLVDLPHVEEAVNKQTPAPKKDKKICCVLL